MIAVCQQVGHYSGPILMPAVLVHTLQMSFCNILQIDLSFIIVRHLSSFMIEILQCAKVEGAMYYICCLVCAIAVVSVALRILL